MLALALSDHSIEGISERMPGAPVKGSHAPPVTGVAQVALYEFHPAPVVQLQPEGHDLSREATIAERDRYWPAGTHHAPEIAQHFYRPGQIVHGDGDGGGIELAVRVGEGRVLVEVLEPVVVQPGIRPQFLFVEAEARDSGVGDLFWEVAYPARHEVEDLSTGWQVFSVGLGDYGYGPVVYVLYEARYAVELLIGRLVLTPVRTCRLLGQELHAPLFACVYESHDNQPPSGCCDHVRRYRTIVLRASHVEPQWWRRLLFERSAEDYLASVSRVWLGMALLARGHSELAERMFEEGLAWARRVQNPSFTYIVLYNLTQLALSGGDLDAATSMLGEGIELSGQTKDRANLAHFLQALSAVEAFRGEVERSAVLSGLETYA